MQPIDPVESLLAVIGIRPIISKEVEKFSMGQAREAADYDKRIYKEAKNVVNGEKYDVPLGTINYKSMLHDLTEEYNDAQLEEMVSKFPPILHAVTSDFIMKAKETVDTLKKMFPVQVKQTILGMESLPPSMLAIRRFVTSLDVIDSPIRILAHIATGSLLTTQMQIVRQIYPTISAAIDDALFEAGSIAKANKKSFQLSGLVTIGYGKWKNQPAITPQLHQQLQQNFADAKAQQQQQKPPTGKSETSDSVVAKEALTNTQRATFPQTIKGQ